MELDGGGNSGVTRVEVWGMRGVVEGVCGMLGIDTEMKSRPNFGLFGGWRGLFGGGEGKRGGRRRQG